MFCKKGVLRNLEKFRVSFFNKVAGQRQAINFIKKETLAQVFSCEFCEISKNTFSYRAPLVAASGSSGPEMFCKICALSNFAKSTGKHLRQSLLLYKIAGLRPQACNFIKKETLAKVFS